MKKTNTDFNWYTFFIVVVASMGGMLYGYDLGIISGAMAFMGKDVALSTGQLQVMPGAVLFGGAFATLVTGPLCDWYGRRKMILIASLIFIAGVFVIATANSFLGLLAGRLIQGMAVGIVTIAIPLYLAEIVPAKIRGEAIGSFQLLLTTGILLSSLVGLFFTQSGNWRGMFWSALFPGILLFSGICLTPESPRWLGLKHRWDAALAVLLKTRSATAATEELKQIRAALADNDHSSTRRKFVWQKQYTRPLLIVLAVACLGQLTAINSFLQLAPTILKDAGLGSNIIAMVGNTVITFINFMMTLVALLLIDRVGRRLLLCIGTAGIVAALTFCGFVFYVLPASEFKGMLLLGGILVFIMFFAIGPGVVIWMVISELLPLRIRSSGMALALFLNSMTSAILATVFLGLADKIGYYGVFWLCAFFTLLYFLTVYFYVPETKNKTLEEIAEHFNSDLPCTASDRKNLSF